MSDLVAIVFLKEGTRIPLEVRRDDPFRLGPGGDADGAAQLI